MNQIERDKKAYDLAKEYLLQLNIQDVTPDLIEKYLCLSISKPRPKSIPEIYLRMLISAQNANMRAGVIGKAIGGVDKLSVVLCNFEPSKVLIKYNNGWNQLLDDIEKNLKPKGKIRRESLSIWPHYCQSILSAAQFINQFPTSEDFYRWVEFFDQDDRARSALPMILAREIDGFGFALACDFLKEIGFVNFAKPDVHLRDIFRGLELCSSKADDYEIFKAIIRVAKNSKVTPYNTDKLFWLIGSGYFYEDQNIGNNGRIGNHKMEFIAFANGRLK